MTVGSLTTTTTYTYEGLNLLSLDATRSDGATWSVSYLIDASGRPYAGIYEATDASATAFQLVTTDRGDVVELLDASGASFAAYRYSEWGLATETTSAATALVGASVAQAISQRQPLRYAGYCLDADEGLYYLSARTYDPVSRQFLSKDPAKADGEESAYQYCGGDPVNKVDPSGTMTAGAIVAAAITTAVVGYVGYRTVSWMIAVSGQWKSWLNTSSVYTEFGNWAKRKRPATYALLDDGADLAYSRPWSQLSSRQRKYVVKNWCPSKVRFKAAMYVFCYRLDIRGYIRDQALVFL